MFKQLQLKRTAPQVSADPALVSVQQIIGNADVPVAIRHINSLPENARRRIFRTLLPVPLLVQYGIRPVSWANAEKTPLIELKPAADPGKIALSAYTAENDPQPFLMIELQDNAFNGIDLNLLVLNDPTAPYFPVDVDADGNSTHFGTIRRNREAEVLAMQAGLSPGQVRASLGGSKLVLEQLETFLAMLAHTAYYLEPLTYASAWVFERRGFAYVRGHKLMDDIHREFQPGGKLYAALDGSTPFRQPGQGNSVRGRAWAIHDGILEAVDARWNNFRMVKQLGRSAGVETFPRSTY